MCIVQRRVAQGDRMNQKQKAIAEKAIRLRFNGFIESLRNTASLVERENENLAAPVPPPFYAVKKERKDEDGSSWLPNVELRKLHRDKLRADKRAAKAQDRLSEKYDKDSAKIEGTRAQIEQVFTEALKQENTQRAEAQRQARTKRLTVVSNLKVQRDEMILAVAFQGEGAEMMAILQGLPKALDVEKALGLKLSRALVEATGIGERNPRLLNG